VLLVEFIDLHEAASPKTKGMRWVMNVKRSIVHAAVELSRKEISNVQTVV